ncbi:hypothetical protein GCM10020256_43630 [Streptomyces thermocoprophilus]
MATGHNHTPRVPDWPGRDGFTGEFLHASAYRNAKPYEGRDVLVVGVGNTGAEIAVDLVEGGAARVRLAVRTAPHIVRRSTAGWAAQYTGILVRRLPVPLVDRLARPVARLSVPDLSAHGLPRPDTGLYSRVTEGAIPVQDVGLIDAVRAGRVEIVAAVDSFDGGRGRPRRRQADRAGRGDRGHGVRTGAGGPRRPSGGCWTAGADPWCTGRARRRTRRGCTSRGFTNPISGMFREMALDAVKIAKAIAAHAEGRVSRLPS